MAIYRGTGDTNAGLPQLEGDMLKSVYDTNNDGIVDQAALADEATHAITADTADLADVASSLDGPADATYVDFDTVTAVAGAVARLKWNDTEGTLDLGLKGGNVTLQLGQEEVVHVYNNTGTAFTDMQVVRITGSSGTRLTAALAQANSEATSATSLAVVTEPIANNTTGFATRGGIVNNVNTNAFNEGDALWLSPSVAGGITNVKPTAPNHLVLVGWCVKKAGGAGQIYVHIQNGYELDELHDVLINGKASGNTLIYDAVTGVWKNANLTAGTGISVTNGAGSITVANTGVTSITGTTSQITASASTGGVTLSLPATINVNTTGNAATASKWAIARDLSFTGDATGTGSVDGSTNVATALTLSNTGVTASTYKSVTVDAKGRVTAGTNPTTLAGYGITDAINTSEKGAANGVATLDSAGTVPLSQINPSLIGGVSYQGTWNASTNTPTLTSSVGTKGFYYVVNVAGATNLNGITDWKIGDWAIFDGSVWGKIDNTDSVTSVNGYTGTVVLSYSDVGAPSTTGTNATGTWGIGISGNAATATTATNQSGGTVAATTGSFSGNVTLSGGTANGVAYLNGSKVLTTGSALTFNGTNLGIGVANPITRLQVNVATDTSACFYSTSANTATIAVLNDAGNTSRQLTLDGQPLIFGVSNVEQMRLTSTGLGIGTSSPGYKLQVNSASGVTSFFQSSSTTAWSAASSDSILQIYNAAVGNNSTALFGAAVNYGDSTYGAIKFGAVASGSYSADFVIANRNVGTLQENLRLTASGNLGLGVTPSAWNTGNSIRAMEFSGGSIFSYSTNEIDVVENAYFDSVGWKYKNSNLSSKYTQYQGIHTWHTAPSGTAGNAISFTQAMTLDASGNLGIGNTAPTAKLQIGVASGNDLTAPTGVGARIIAAGYTTTGTPGFLQLSGGYGDGGNVGAWNIKAVPVSGGGYALNNVLTFSTQTSFGNVETERMRIDSSGNLLVGTTAFANASGGVAVASGATGENLRSSATLTSAWGHYGFYNANGRVGLISTTGTATTYATSSDYRLKENIKPMQNALGVVAQLNPVTYNWKADGSDGQGFIAHELQSVVPDCVTGEKDAVDAEGKPVYQGIDTSFLVATLTKAIQELNTEVQSLKAEIAALKGA